MAILIKGMEMPESCEECKFFAWKLGVGNHCAVCPDITFHVIIDGCDVSYERNGDCPLVEVPEPHGRLIDADKLKSYWEPDHSRYFDADYFIHTIDVAKSIIPASESKERPAFLPQYKLTPRSEEG